MEIKVAVEPVLPPRLFKNRSVVALLLCTFFISLSFQAVNFHMAIYFQVVRGDSATSSGLRMLASQLGLTVTTISTGRFIAVTGRYKVLLSIGSALVATAIGLLSLLDTNTSWLRKKWCCQIQSCQAILILFIVLRDLWYLGYWRFRIWIYVCLNEYFSSSVSREARYW